MSTEHSRPTAGGPEPQPSLTSRDQRPPQARFELTVAPSLGASASARAALGRWLAGAHCPSDLAGDMILVVSELVTNAVTHAASAACVTVTIGDDRLRLEVHDHSPRPPQQRDDGMPGGFGLRLVSTLSDEWGWTRTPSGKFVWVEIPYSVPIPT